MPPQPRELVAVLPPDPASAGRARELTRSSCREWDLPDLVDDLSLLVTELVANAVRHAGTDVGLRLVALDDGVRLEVSDGSVRPLRRREAGIDAESGRGLMLIDALSTRYGVEADPHGKRVWAEVRTAG